jgi:4-amino-4-deoxy-L-arabinose transferase-like glycosyltransferase
MRSRGGQPGDAPLPRRTPWSVWVALIGAVQLAVLLVTSTRYGYHRDELYFIVAGGHAAFGYPDQPPLVPLLSWAMNAIAPGSLLALRAPSAIAATATTILAAAVAREVGGGARAQTIAAACTAASGFALAVAHLVSTTTFDMLSTTAFGWLMVRGVMRRSPACFLAAGLVVGVGVEAKPQVGLVAVVMAAALLALGPRSLLRSRWAVGGILAAVVLAAPYAIWQQQHGWPQLTVARHIAGSEEGGRAGFLPFQLIMVSPLLVPVWVAGLLAPFRRAHWRDLRFLTIAYLTLAAVYLAGDGKAYYLASLYPLLLGLGAIPTAEWTARGRWRVRALAAAVVVSAAFSALIALPLLPERELRGSIVVSLNPTQAETVGWPRFVHTVVGAWRRIPAGQREHAAIFTSNYGEAGAIAVLGSTQLPRAYSGHNGFGEWGEPPNEDTQVLLVGYEDAREAAPYFDACRTLATVNDGVGLANQEQGLPLMLCSTRFPWRRLWPHLVHYN